jgi:hypothetical protein
LPPLGHCQGPAGVQQRARRRPCLAWSIAMLRVDGGAVVVMPRPSWSRTRRFGGNGVEHDDRGRKRQGSGPKFGLPAVRYVM